MGFLHRGKAEGLARHVYRLELLHLAHVPVRVGEVGRERPLLYGVLRVQCGQSQELRRVLRHALQAQALVEEQEEALAGAQAVHEGDQCEVVLDVEVEAHERAHWHHEAAELPAERAAERAQQLRVPRLHELHHHALLALGEGLRQQRRNRVQQLKLPLLVLEEARAVVREAHYAPAAVLAEAHTHDGHLGVHHVEAARLDVGAEDLVLVDEGGLEIVGVFQRALHLRQVEAQQGLRVAGLQRVVRLEQPLLSARGQLHVRAGCVHELLEVPEPRMHLLVQPDPVLQALADEAQRVLLDLIQPHLRIGHAREVVVEGHVESAPALLHEFLAHEAACEVHVCDHGPGLDALRRAVAVVEHLALVVDLDQPVALDHVHHELHEEQAVLLEVEIHRLPQKPVNEALEVARDHVLGELDRVVHLSEVRALAVEAVGVGTPVLVLLHLHDELVLQCAVVGLRVLVLLEVLEEVMRF